METDRNKKVKKYHPSADVTQIEKAYQIAFNAHNGQVRKSGEPYIIHPICVAMILADLELDKETIVGGLLHDVVEILYVGIWGPGYMHVKGCRHVKMYQVVCPICSNN